MSDSVWRSKAFRHEYAWLVSSLHPGRARTKAYAEFMISDEQLASLMDAAGDRMRHNEMLLEFLRQREDAFPCLVAIVSDQEHQDVAERLRQALFPPPSPQPNQHSAGASAAQPDPQGALPVDHTLAHQSQPVLEKPRCLPKPPLLSDEPLEPAKRQPAYVYPLDTPANVSEAHRLQDDTQNSRLVFDVSPSSNDMGIDSDVNIDVMTRIKIIVWREKCAAAIDVTHIRHILKKKFKVRIEREYISDEEDEVLSGDAMTTVKIVIGVDKLAMKSQRKEVVARVQESLHWCAVENLLVRCVDDGSIVIYAFIPISDLIRLYQVATHYPGVLAGIGILEISTLGKTTVISFSTSPAGPVEEPIHPSLAAFIGDMAPGQADVIFSEPNTHYAVRAFLLVLLLNLPADGEVLPKVIKWLEKHRNDVLNTPSLIAMDREGDQSSSGVSSISTTSQSVSGKVGDSTTNKVANEAKKHGQKLAEELQALKSQVLEQRTLARYGNKAAEVDLRTDYLEDRAANAVLMASAALRQGEKVTETVGRLDQQLRQQGSVCVRLETAESRMKSMEQKLLEQGRTLTVHDIQAADLNLRADILDVKTTNGVLIWKIGDVRRRRREAISGRTPSLKSAPFYTSPEGYKMCARIYLDGDGMGRGSCISLFFVIMKGEFDALLPWPFQLKVTISLLDQSQVPDVFRQNITSTIEPSQRSASFKQPESELNEGIGFPEFALLNVIDSPTSEYIRDDTIFIKIKVDERSLTM